MSRHLVWACTPGSEPANGRAVGAARARYEQLSEWFGGTLSDGNLDFGVVVESDRSRSGGTSFTLDCVAMLLARRTSPGDDAGNLWADEMAVVPALTPTSWLPAGSIPSAGVTDWQARPAGLTQSRALRSVPGSGLPEGPATEDGPGLGGGHEACTRAVVRWLARMKPLRLHDGPDGAGYESDQPGLSVYLCDDAHVAVRLWRRSKSP
jgi:hypothetical protein